MSMLKEVSVFNYNLVLLIIEMQYSANTKLGKTTGYYSENIFINIKPLEIPLRRVLLLSRYVRCVLRGQNVLVKICVD